jgi:hypothetical protein
VRGEISHKLNPKFGAPTKAVLPSSQFVVMVNMADVGVADSSKALALDAWL